MMVKPLISQVDWIGCQIKGSFLYRNNLHIACISQAIIKRWYKNHERNAINHEQYTNEVKVGITSSLGAYMMYKNLFYSSDYLLLLLKS